jgi:hypothetical protein
MARSRKYVAALFLATVAIACTDTQPTIPDAGSKDAEKSALDPTSQLVVLNCEASRKELRVTCTEPQAGGNKGKVAADIVYGGQNTFVTLTSTNVAYNSGTGRFTFDVTVKNLLQQSIGTTDGTTLAPTGVRAFFQSGPTVTGGSGVAAVLPDGFGTFTAAGQSYYQYDQVIANGVTSTAKTWTIIISPTVDTFTFLLMVSAPVQFPNGYIEINGQFPGAHAGLLHPGSTSPLTAVVKNQLGIVQPGAVVTWGTTDPNQASVDGSGVVTGVRYGSPVITATSGGLNGSISFDVTGTVRNWTGAVSSDWEVGGNWGGGYMPALVDTANIPAAVSNFPALTVSESIGGLTIEDAATLSLGAFDLQLSNNAATGQGSGGVTGTTGTLILAGNAGSTVGGRFSLVKVTGDYTQNADVRVTAPIVIPSGRLFSPGYLTWILAQ